MTDSDPLEPPETGIVAIAEGPSVAVRDVTRYAHAVAAIMATPEPVFRTHEQRDAFFRRVEEHPFSIAYGSAMQQARAAGGIWEQDNRRLRDCTKIMAYEVRRRGLEQSVSLPDVDMLAGYVTLTPTMDIAYALARRPHEAAMHNLVRSLGANDRHMEELRAELTADEERLLGRAHEMILDEIIEMLEADRGFDEN